MKIGGRASGYALPGRAWERVKMSKIKFCGTGILAVFNNYIKYQLNESK